jgi:hypothetical protein
MQRRAAGVDLFLDANRHRSCRVVADGNHLRCIGHVVCITTWAVAARQNVRSLPTSGGLVMKRHPFVHVFQNLALIVRFRLVHVCESVQYVMLYSRPCSCREGISVIEIAHPACANLRKVLASLFDSALDPQKQSRLPLVQLAHLIVLE